tara:strand:+ start:142 stop:282 length:141 start_codon:yes stop_codon:yes gene_type:complete
VQTRLRNLKKSPFFASQNLLANIAPTESLAAVKSRAIAFEIDVYIK